MEKAAQNSGVRVYAKLALRYRLQILKLILFTWPAVIFSDTRVWSRPCSRFIHSFFPIKRHS